MKIVFRTFGYVSSHYSKQSNIHNYRLIFIQYLSIFIFIYVSLSIVIIHCYHILSSLYFILLHKIIASRIVKIFKLRYKLFIGRTIIAASVQLGSKTMASIEIEAHCVHIWQIEKYVRSDH